MIEFDWKISLGNLLTFLSIVISAAGLGWTWQKDINSRQREQATEVRKAAAATLAKLERVNQLTELLFDDLQPIIIDTTDQLAERRDAPIARDFFWKSVTAARLLHRKRFMDEQIESAYVGLYSYMQDARAMFRDAIGRLRSAEDRSIDAILQKCQDSILSYGPDRLHSYQPAQLGNELRQVVTQERDAYLKQAQTILADIQTRLAGIVAARDETIIASLNARNL